MRAIDRGVRPRPCRTMTVSAPSGGDGEQTESRDSAEASRRLRTPNQAFSRVDCTNASSGLPLEQRVLFSGFERRPSRDRHRPRSERPPHESGDRDCSKDLAQG